MDTWTAVFIKTVKIPSDPIVRFGVAAEPNDSFSQWIIRHVFAFSFLNQSCASSSIDHGNFSLPYAVVSLLDAVNYSRALRLCQKV